MNRVAITGLGFISSIGHDVPTVCHHLRTGCTGIRPFPLFIENELPCHLAGTIEGFSFPHGDCEDWVIPEPYHLSRSQRRTMAPNSVYGTCALQQAIADAALPADLLSHPRTGLHTASLGSMRMNYENFSTMFSEGLLKFPPHGVTSTVMGTLNFNLATHYQIKGATSGFTSACSSSAHALGYAFDLIRSGRQDRVFVVGAEELDLFVQVPFMAIRAMSTRNDPLKTPSAFCRFRDGFIPTGGAAAIVLERLESAQQREAKIYGEMRGWGQTSDGYNVMAPEPSGDGLARAMALALEDAQLAPEAIDYLNGHATATTLGDLAELRAIKKVFPDKRPWVSSTKSLTGHGISMAGTLEAAISCLALKEGFMPLSAHITELDPEAAGVPILVERRDEAPRFALSNSSGFGGSNVSLIFAAASP
jgi:3-oxoacyl-[acyl-carrier-protein] synthase I